MQSINRAIMLLKPLPDSVKYDNAAGTLRLVQTPRALSLRLKTTGLPPGAYDLYLFADNGAYTHAARFDSGGAEADVRSIRLEDIAGAAVVHSDNAHRRFCLVSTGIDWAGAIARFRIREAPHDVSSDPTAQPEAREENSIMPSAPGAQKDVADMQDAFDTPPPDITGQPANDALSETPAPPELGIACADCSAPSEEPPPQAPSAKNAAPDAPCSTCPHVTHKTQIEPFPSVFPGSAWVKVSYSGPTGWWHYISGTIYSNGNVTAKVLGVPGEYGMAPPIWLEGFGTYLRCSSGDASGYWLMFQDAETGEVLDPA